MGRVGRDAIGMGMVGTLLTLVSPPAARADTSVADLAAKIERLEAENRQMRDDISKLRTQTRAKADKPRAAKPDGKPDTRIDPATDTLVRTADAPRRPEAPPTKPTALGAVASPRMAAGPRNGQMQVGDITITPGGYVAAEGIFRTRATQADIATPFAAIPTLNQSFAHTNEFRYTSRQSRAAVLAEAPLSPSVSAAGYAEVDFLGAAQTATNVESNSYNPRIRVLYGQLDSDTSGFHLLAGQNWTLATTNTKGILPRDEALPPTIDEQFVTGFVWTRQPQLRLTKDFNQKVWVALSAEQPNTTFGGSGGCVTGSGTTTLGSPAVTGVAALTCEVFPQGSGGFNSTTTPYSLNHVPDVIAKVAVDPTIAGRDVHLEAYGLYRDLFDRVTYTSGFTTNHDTTGYGFGGGLVTDLVKDKLNLTVSGLIGRGIGRYATSTLPDATFGQDGSVKPIPEAAFMAGLTLHATSSLDIYAFGGFERQLATYFANGATSFYGIGLPNANDSGCNNELSTACSTDTKQTMEITAGFWDNIYSGRYGTVKGGVQYGFTTRSLFPSVYAGQSYAPKVSDNLLYTSFRFYPFYQ